MIEPVRAVRTIQLFTILFILGESGAGCHMGWLSHVLYLRLQSSHGTEISFAVVF
jgi:hypothetical protein